MSEQTSFKRDVQGLFSRYVADMNKVKLSNPDSTGVQRLYLNDYASVKAFAWQIQVAIHGYDYDSRKEKWLVEAGHRLRAPGGRKGSMSSPRRTRCRPTARCRRRASISSTSGSGTACSRDALANRHRQPLMIRSSAWHTQV